MDLPDGNWNGENWQLGAFRRVASVHLGTNARKSGRKHEQSGGGQASAYFVMTIFLGHVTPLCKILYQQCKIFYVEYKICALATVVFVSYTGHELSVGHVRCLFASAPAWFHSFVTRVPNHCDSVAETRRQALKWLTCTALINIPDTITDGVWTVTCRAMISNLVHHGEKPLRACCIFNSSNALLTVHALSLASHAQYTEGLSRTRQPPGIPPNRWHRCGIIVFQHSVW